MIHIFGDSHAGFNFKNLSLPNENHYIGTITMHRVGRDGLDFINFKNYGVNDNDIIIFQYGEIDCRCHIIKQMSENRDLNEIIDTLVSNYMNTIKINALQYNNLKIIVCCVPPPLCVYFYQKYHNIYEYPIHGTNEERIINATQLNIKLKQKCDENGYIFLDYYKYYMNENGLLRPELSDNNVHIKENSKILELLVDILT